MNKVVQFGPSVPVLSTLEMLQMQLGEAFAGLSESDIDSALAFDSGSRERNESLREMERAAFGRLSRAEVTWRGRLILVTYCMAGAIPGGFIRGITRPGLNEEKTREAQSSMGEVLELAIDAGVLRAVGCDVYYEIPPPEITESEALWNEVPETPVQTFPPPLRSSEEIGAIAVCVEVARKAVSELMARIDAEINERVRAYE